MRTIRKIEFSPARIHRNSPRSCLRRTIKIHQEKSVNAWVLPTAQRREGRKGANDSNSKCFSIFTDCRQRKTARSRREEINTRNLISSLRMMPPLVLIMKIYLPNPKSHYDFHAPKFFRFFFAAFLALKYSLCLDRGSRGPSTVTLIALVYVAIWHGYELIVMVIVNDLPRPLRPTKRRSLNFAT